MKSLVRKTRVMSQVAKKTCIFIFGWKMHWIFFYFSNVLWCENLPGVGI